MEADTKKGRVRKGRNRREAGEKEFCFPLKS
jgi:hypothetical protein